MYLNVKIESSCTSINQLRCYDAFSMVQVSGNDDNCNDNPSSQSLAVYTSVAAVTGFVFGGLALYLIALAGWAASFLGVATYRHYVESGAVRRLSRPLVPYEQLKVEEEQGVSAPPVTNPVAPEVQA